MNIHTVSLFPSLFNTLNQGIPSRALDKNRLTLTHHTPRDFTSDPHRTVDDRPFGGGPGMVMMAAPLIKAINHAQSQCASQAKTIYLSPQGKALTQAKVNALAKESHLILICGRYEGIDERVIENHIDEEISLGDFVISGGELAACVVIDAITRMLPGVLGDADSALQDSFVSGLLDHPHYTRPENNAGKNVPPVLLSGNHKAIVDWRLQQALGKTWQKRPDLLENRSLSTKEQQLLDEYIQALPLN